MFFSFLNTFTLGMKKQLLKYYFLLFALLMATFSCFPNQLHQLQLGSKNSYENNVSCHSSEEITYNITTKKVFNETFLKAKIQQTFVNHSKGNFPQTEFEVETIKELKKAKPLLKINLLRFLIPSSNHLHCAKSAHIPFKLNHFYCYLKDTLYLKFQVMRL